MVSLRVLWLPYESLSSRVFTLVIIHIYAARVHPRPPTHTYSHTDTHTQHSHPHRKFFLYIIYLLFFHGNMLSYAYTICPGNPGLVCVGFSHCFYVDSCVHECSCAPSDQARYIILCIIILYMCTCMCLHFTTCTCTCTCMHM